MTVQELSVTKFRTAVFAALGSLAVLAHADEPSGDLDRLQGTWDRVKYHKTDGTEVLEKKGKHTTTFQGDDMIIRSTAGGEKREGTWKIRLDASTTPKSLDWGSSARPGIYDLGGDTLRVASASGPQADWKRPTKLAPCSKDSPSKWTYMVYKRVKP